MSLKTLASVVFTGSNTMLTDDESCQMLLPVALAESAVLAAANPSRVRPVFFTDASFKDHVHCMYRVHEQDPVCRGFY